MRVSHYPLRPLSDAGKALLAVLVSVFATLLLLCWSPPHADSVNVDAAANAGEARGVHVTSASSAP